MVASAGDGVELCRVLSGEQVEVAQAPGLFVIESARYKAFPASDPQVWCDAVIVQMLRLLPREDVESWAESLLEASWGGLVFLSQASNGLLRSPPFCRQFVDWFLLNKVLIQRVGDRFATDVSRGPLWCHGNNLMGALAELGVKAGTLRACRSLPDIVAVAEQARRADGGS